MSKGDKELKRLRLYKISATVSYFNDGDLERNEEDILVTVLTLPAVGSKLCEAVQNAERYLSVLYSFVEKVEVYRVEEKSLDEY